MESREECHPRYAGEPWFRPEKEGLEPKPSGAFVLSVRDPLGYPHFPRFPDLPLAGFPKYKNQTNIYRFRQEELLCMRFFLDTANLDEIQKAVDWGVVCGVTTNPTLVAREGAVDFHTHVRTIAGMVDGPVSAEVVSVDKEGMIQEARQLARIHHNVVVKIPMTPEGMSAVNALSVDGIRTNVTLVFSVNQALLASAAGATFVSPFVGRIDDVGQDGMNVVREIVAAFGASESRTQVLAASIRHSRHVAEAALAGADVATIPFGVLETIFRHPLTDRGVERFLADWEEYRRRNG